MKSSSRLLWWRTFPGSSPPPPPSPGRKPDPGPARLHAEVGAEWTPPVDPAARKSFAICTAKPRGDCSDRRAASPRQPTPGKVTAGASLIQVYSALVYEGPPRARNSRKGLRNRLAGGRWEDAVGSAAGESVGNRLGDFGFDVSKGRKDSPNESPMNRREFSPAPPPPPSWPRHPPPV